MCMVDFYLHDPTYMTRRQLWAEQDQASLRFRGLLRGHFWSLFVRQHGAVGTTADQV